MWKSRSIVFSLVLSAVLVCSSAAAPEKIALRYRPKVGEKRVMRVAYHLTTTYPSRSGQDCMEHIRTYTLEVEPLSVGIDGRVVTRIGIQQISLKSFQHSDGRVFRNFDSTRDLYKSDLFGGIYRAPLGESFTVETSAQGKVLKCNVDAFYEALARNRIRHETEVLAHMAKFNRAWGQKESEAWNRQYGSIEQRKQAYREDASKFEPCAMETLQLLVSSVLVPFASEPAPAGGDWKAPVLISIEALMELSGTYRLQTVEDDVCTIQVEAQRTAQDRTLAEQRDLVRGRSPLEGRYEATLRVDRTTGRLLARQDRINLSGGLFMPTHGMAKSDGTVPITADATTTVEEVNEPLSSPQRQ
jgi:hypothetical protein